MALAMKKMMDWNGKKIHRSCSRLACCPGMLRVCGAVHSVNGQCAVRRVLDASVVLFQADTDKSHSP